MSFRLLGFFLPFALAACANAPNEEPNHYTLKVVTTPQGHDPSARCTEIGDSPGTNGDNFTGAWIETESHTDGATTYDVRITGHDGVLHQWHYDEDLARAGATLTASYTDTDGVTTVSIAGLFERVDPCRP